MCFTASKMTRVALSLWHGGPEKRSLRTGSPFLRPTWTLPSPLLLCATTAAAARAPANVAAPHNAFLLYLSATVDPPFSNITKTQTGGGLSLVGSSLPTTSSIDDMPASSWWGYQTLCLFAIGFQSCFMRVLRGRGLARVPWGGCPWRDFMSFGGCRA